MTQGGSGASRWRKRAAGVVLAASAASTTWFVGTGTAGAAATDGVGAAVQAAAAQASDAGYRTGIAVLDLQTGAYYGAGDDTGSFASESVMKVFIATDLLLTGQMSGDTASTAYQMITESDDDDADALYGLVGGDDVVDEVAQHYDIDDLGTPPSQPGWWGSTEIDARGLVQFYADVAKDPTVAPWLLDAMAHATQYGADGTDQTFGIPSATTGAAVKQGWGDDGNDSPNAVFNSTGYVDNHTFAVAILTDGPPDTYGSDISAELTAEARAIMPGGTIDDPTLHNPSVSGVAASADGNTVHVTGTASDPDAPGGVPVQVQEGTTTVASGTSGAGGHFDVAVHATDGTHTYRVVVPDVGEGTTDAISASTAAVTVNGTPAGAVTAVTGGPGTVTITGRDADPNLAEGQEPDVTVTINGRDVRTVPVDEPTAASGTSPTAAGFRLTVPAPRGQDQVAVTFVGSDGAPNLAARTWSATVGPSPEQVRRHDVAVIATASAGVVALLLVGAGGMTLRRRLRRRRPATSWSEPRLFRHLDM